MKEAVDNLGQSEKRDKYSRKATVNVSFVTDECSYLLTTLIASGRLYAQDKGLEWKAGGYAQNQKRAVVSAETFCASFKLLMRQQHKEPRDC